MIILFADVCRLPSFTGRCKARHPRWYYNTAQRECQQFIYGGCGGNGNRFRTKVDCERQCLSGTKGNAVVTGENLLIFTPTRDQNPVPGLKVRHSMTLP